MKNALYIFILVLAAGCASTGEQTDLSDDDSGNQAAVEQPSKDIPAATSAAKNLKFQPLELKIIKPESFILKNGIKVFYLKDDELPLVHVKALLRTGSAWEPADKMGLASLMGAAMRSGGAASFNASEIDEKLEFIGAEIGLQVSRESSEANLDVVKKDLDIGMKIFHEVITRPVFDEEKLKLTKEQTVVGLTRKLATPDDVAGWTMRRMIYKNHPYASFQDGFAETVRSISRADLMKFHAAFLSPENIVLGVTGDITKEDAEKRLNETFGTLEKSALSLGVIPEVPADEKAEILLLDNPRLTQTTIYLGHLGYKRLDPVRIKAGILSHILSRRLYREIREKRGWAYSVFSFFAPMTETGFFAAFLQTKPDSAVESIKIIKAEIEKIMKEPVASDELEDARSSVLNGFVFNFESKKGIVGMFMSFSFFAFPDDYLDIYYKEMKEMTASDLQDAAKKYLKPAKLKIMVLGSKAQIGAALGALGGEYRESVWQQGRPPKIE